MADMKKPSMAILLGGKPKMEASGDDGDAEAEEDDDDPDGGSRDAAEALLEAIKGEDPDGVAQALRTFFKIHQNSPDGDEG